MPGIRESQGTITLAYNAEPAIVAQACQDALKSVGKVKSVEKETGIITGKIDAGWTHAGATVTIQIKRKEKGTEISIQGTAAEGLLTGGGAQKCLGKFTEALARNPALSGLSESGW